MRQLNETVIPTQTAASVVSAAIPALNLFNCSVQIAATGAAAGTLQLQASNDDTNGESNTVPTNWSNITGASVVVSGAGAYLIPVQDICYQYIRVSYTNTGTGTISVVLKALGE